MNKKFDQTLYIKLMEHMSEGVCMTDENGNASYVNTKLCNLLGMEFDEIVGKSASAFLDAKSQRKVKHIDKQEREKGMSSNYDINIVTKLGNSIPVNLNGTPLPDGGTIGIMSDLREKQAREEKEKILYNAVQFSSDGIMICDMEGTITFWNKGAQLIFGRRHDEVIQKNLSIAFSKKDVHTILQRNNETSKYETNKYEIKGRNKNRSILNIAITQTPILDSQKKNIISYLLICRDVTDHRKAEEEIASKYKKIQEVYTDIGVLKRQADYTQDLLKTHAESQGDISSIANFIVTSIIMLTKVDGCELRILNRKKDALEMISHFGFSQDWSGKKKIKFSGSLAEEAFKKGSSMKIIDLQREPKYQTPGLARKHKMTSLLLIPLSAKGECTGVLSLYARANKKLEIFENEFIEKYAKVIELVLAQY